MKPKVKLAEARIAEGKQIALYEHDGDYSISLDSQELMHSRAHASELLLGTLGVRKLLPDQAAVVLIGGLGLGYTLRAVLEASGASVSVDVIELVPEVVAWNESFLKPLNGDLLNDPRVTLKTEDVTRLVRQGAPESYDVVLLDIDNGPMPMVAERNKTLYSFTGLRAVYRALRPKGRAVFWSAVPDADFEIRLKRAGFRVDAVPAKIHAAAKRAAYMLYVADKA